MIYVTSDLHLGHANIIRHCARPFASVGEMDAALIAGVNATVGVSDTLYILGDFTMYGSLERVRQYRAQINCKYVHLIRGNHDKRFVESGQESPFSSELDYLEYTAQPDKMLFCMSHYPFMSWRRQYHGSIMLHGHIHASTDYNFDNARQGIRRYDVGVDANEYLPVPLDEIRSFFEVHAPEE